jgi:hypothetical protein
MARHKTRSRFHSADSSHSNSDPLLQWVADSRQVLPKPQPDGRLERGSDFQHEIGFTSSLSECCLRLLTQIWSQFAERGRSRGSLKARLREYRARLCVFEDAFSGGKLDLCLSLSQDLQRTMVGLLYQLGDCIIKGTSVNPSYKQVETLKAQIFTRICLNNLDPSLVENVVSIEPAFLINVTPFPNYSRPCIV